MVSKTEYGQEDSSQGLHRGRQRKCKETSNPAQRNLKNRVMPSAVAPAAAEYNNQFSTKAKQEVEEIEMSQGKKGYDIQ